jgi:SAM-dependent methyltransferase
VDASQWDARYAAAERVWSVTPNQFVASELADLPAGRALDVACGEGRNAIWLAQRGWSVTAIDFAGVAIERGRNEAPDLAVTWVVGDVLETPLPEVDLVVVAYLQLPTDQRRPVVRRAFEAMAVGGTFLLVAHDSSNLTEGTGGPQDPRFLYTAADVLADLDGLNHTVVRAERVARVVSSDDGHGGTAQSTALDALVRVVRS